jgi:hypothetical protein
LQCNYYFVRGGCGHGFFDVEGIAKLFILDRKILSKGILYKKEVLDDATGLGLQTTKGLFVFVYMQVKYSYVMTGDDGGFHSQI